MMPSSRKPPLPRSPIRLRPRRHPPPPPLQPSNPNTILHTPPPGSLAKSQLPKGDSDVEDPESSVHPEYHTISCELRALAKMVHHEFSSVEDSAHVALAATTNPTTSLSVDRSGLFERGRFYDEYSARRNERLKRKKGGITGEYHDGNNKYDLGVRVESVKRRGGDKTKERFECLRKTNTVPSTPTPTPTTTTMEKRFQQQAPPSSSSSRYLLRSSTAASKEDKKPPLAIANVEGSAPGIIGDKKITVRRARKF